MARKPSISRVVLRSATEVKHYRVFMRILPVLVTVLVSLVTIIYVTSIMYNRYGSYTVMVDKFDSLKYSISLSETEDFLYPTAKLNSKASENVVNISEADLPLDLDQIDGEHNGTNYIAYTYYLKNTGTSTLTYEYVLYIVNTSNGIDRAVRVRLYVDGEYVNYAKTSTDGTGPEPNTTPFITDTTITRAQVQNFAPDDVTKFTVVIWIEGDDPDTTDDVIGGQFKIDMKLSIVGEDIV